MHTPLEHLFAWQQVVPPQQTLPPAQQTVPQQTLFGAHVVPGTTAVPPWQVPFWQVSPVVHGLASSHVVPFLVVSPTQLPVPVSHVWH